MKLCPEETALEDFSKVLPIFFQKVLLSFPFLEPEFAYLFIHFLINSTIIKYIFYPINYILCKA